MPELPEVETICRCLRPHVVNKRITTVRTTVDRLRSHLDEPHLQAFCHGERVADVRRRGKHIIVELSQCKALLIHLGMTGAFRIRPQSAPFADHERVIWCLDDDTTWRFIDVRRFGDVRTSVLCAERDEPPELRDLGPEPLTEAFNASVLIAASRGRQRPIKNMIMDQRFVVGVGNIYATEALFRARVRPQRACRRIGPGTAERLVACIKQVLADAIEWGGTTISDFRSVDGTEGKFRLHLAAYGREGEPCPRCGDAATIRRCVQAGRSSFYCPQCQR